MSGGLDFYFRSAADIRILPELLLHLDWLAARQSLSQLCHN
jgi:hypothetical protein